MIKKFIRVILETLSGKELARLLFEVAAKLAAPHVVGEAEKALSRMSAEAWQQSGQDALDYHDAVEANDRKLAATIISRAVGRFRL